MRLRRYGVFLAAVCLCSFSTGGQKLSKDDQKNPCVKQPTSVGGIPVECTVFRSPVFPLTETSYYQAEVAAARNDALEANHASFRVLTLLADPDKNNNVDAVKAVRELKKKVDQLCKRLRCEEKKEKK